VDGGLYAAASGELFALDPATGHILWNNKLKGLGIGFVTIAGSNQTPPAAAELRRRQAQAAAAAGAAGA
jgi:outer membrane protein assembly factor BamB